MNAPDLVPVPVASLANATSPARGRFAAATWVLAFVAIVGLAVVGRLMEPSRPTARAALVVLVAPSDSASPGASRAPATNAQPPDVIVLSSPAIANAEITTRELTVRGYLATGSGTIRVTLEARGNRIIDEATIEPGLVFAERPTVGRHAQFETRFGLPNPRPNGRMIVQVALIDEDGQIVDVIRRPIRVGPLLSIDGLGA